MACSFRNLSLRKTIVMLENEIGRLVLDAAYKVHSSLGAGLLESAYEACLIYETLEQGLVIAKQVPIPVIYKNIRLDCGYRLDLLVNEKVIVEVKAVEELNEIHLAQLMTYLKLTGCKLGYLINFNVKSLKNGIRRVVMGL